MTNMVAIDRSIERAVTASLAAALSHKLLFVAVGLLTFVSAGYVILSLEPVYEASALVLTGQQNPELSPGARQPVETSVGLIRTASSDEVVRGAASSPHFARLLTEPAAEKESIFVRMRARLFGAEAMPHRATSPVDAGLPALKRRVVVKGEAASNVIEIAFRDSDPRTAADFANALAKSFIDRQLSLKSRLGALEFFTLQRERFDEELRIASGDLQRFTLENGLYSITQQRELLLTRQSQLAAAMAATRSAIAEKQGQRQALTEQLRKLAPVAKSPYVSSIVEALGEERAPKAGARQDDSRSVEPKVFDAPLLLVRVYQESMVALFKLNADLAGATNLEQLQLVEQASLVAELDKLSQKAEQLDRLQRIAAQAAYNADLLAKRVVEEQTNVAVNVARFSSLKVLQSAIEPQQPIFPNYKLLFAAAAVFSAAVAFTSVVLRGRIRS